MDGLAPHRRRSDDHRRARSAVQDLVAGRINRSVPDAPPDDRDPGPRHRGRTFRAARNADPEATRSWVTAGLLSDSLDVVTSLVSIPAIGVAEGLGATAAALSFVGSDPLSASSRVLTAGC